MTARPHLLQVVLAHAALFLLPFPALNFGVSLTAADVFLLGAVLLNAQELLRLHRFQLPFLAALPFFLISALTDADGDLISVVQILYIWGFVLPFGWCAFTQLPRRRIAQVVLFSAVLNSTVAAGQNAMILPMLESQRTILIHGEVARAAGLSNGCNSLVMGLTPCFLLLPYLQRSWMRVVVLLVLVLGLLSSVSKSVLLAAPGLLFYLWKERQKGHVLPALALAAGLGVAGIQWFYGWEDFVDRLVETLDARMQNTESSIDTRAELIAIAADYVPQCIVYGFGTEGTHARISEAADNTVHMYYLGLVVIAGLGAAALLMWGMWLQLRQLWAQGDVCFAAFLAAHLLACLVMTVLLLSFQSLPFMLAGAVISRGEKRQPAAARPIRPPAPDRPAVPLLA